MTTTAKQTTAVSKEQLLKHWQGHRNLTRRVIEAFPEKELFEFSIGGMRPFAKLVAELLAIGGPALKGIVEQDERPYNEAAFEATSKKELLKLWDTATKTINTYYRQIPEAGFQKIVNLFGQYAFPVYENIFYFIDNEIHHRAQGYVYLRALGITPPFFWERGK
ncbi:damage-inducible protein DinB [Niabella ginsenosidivorans]|uniref:Damage-inducible protein DinB n=1 Tax=Niabella ginsenosidivorans TaxID=1176587 RepID=A0A1A9HXE2_9BACT|nr:DinB family protein [Niabella ginsenosidivorans]ANH79903.1 damage-inducible protein DinB [Niabella ginsenosidivorans]